MLIAEKTTLLQKPAVDMNVDTDGDEIDEIQGKQLMDLTSKLNSRNLAKLKQIELALKRIDNKTYGYCEDCNELIIEKRLLHNPHFQTCVECAEEREIEEKQRKLFNK